jgi:Transglutaminase-like superfamily
MTRPGRLVRSASYAASAPGDGWLLARMLAWRTVLPLLKRRVPLATLARVMWQKPRARSQPGRFDRIPDLVQRLYRGFRPGQDDICLERSLLTYRFLSRAGADPRLVIGMREAGGSVIGHAWVVVDGEPLFEPATSLGEYASFFSFGRDGTVDTSAPDGVPAREAVTG